MLKIFFTSDIHGSDICFRKLLDAASLHAVDALIVGGDISGKQVAPTTERASPFERTLRNRGHHPVRVTHDEIPTATSPAMELLAIDAMRTSIANWLELAESRLRGTGIECYVMLGNDDPPELAELIDQSDTVVNPDGRIVSIHGVVEMLSLGYSNLTPFHSHRELPEPRIAAVLNELADKLSDVHAAIFNVHVPPHASNLDNAPERDERLKVKTHNGKPRFIPVGSTAVRQVLLERQPLLGLHGHVHESGGSTRLGGTLCINPGSSYSTGVLHGAVIALDRGRVHSYQLVTCR